MTMFHQYTMFGAVKSIDGGYQTKCSCNVTIEGRTLQECQINAEKHCKENNPGVVTIPNTPAVACPVEGCVAIYTAANDAPPNAAREMLALHLREKHDMYTATPVRETRTPGQIAYEGYYRKSGGISVVSQTKLPLWDDPDASATFRVVKECWEAAAIDVLIYCVDELDIRTIVP